MHANTAQHGFGPTSRTYSMESTFLYLLFKVKEQSSILTAVANRTISSLYQMWTIKLKDIKGIIQFLIYWLVYPSYLMLPRSNGWGENLVQAVIEECSCRNGRIGQEKKLGSKGVVLGGSWTLAWSLQEPWSINCPLRAVYIPILLYGVGGLLSNVWIIAMCNILDRVAPVCPGNTNKGETVPVSSYRGEFTWWRGLGKATTLVTTVSVICITHTDQKEDTHRVDSGQVQMRSFHHFHRYVTLLILMDDDHIVLVNQEAHLSLLYSAFCCSFITW